MGVGWHWKINTTLLPAQKNPKILLFISSKSLDLVPLWHLPLIQSFRRKDRSVKICCVSWSSVHSHQTSHFEDSVVNELLWSLRWEAAFAVWSRITSNGQKNFSERGNFHESHSRHTHPQKERPRAGGCLQSAHRCLWEGISPDQLN